MPRNVFILLQCNDEPFVVTPRWWLNTLEGDVCFTRYLRRLKYFRLLLMAFWRHVIGTPNHHPQATRAWFPHSGSVNDIIIPEASKICERSRPKQLTRPASAGVHFHSDRSEQE